MAMAGGAMLGYWLIGSLRIESPDQHDHQGNHPGENRTVDKNFDMVTPFAAGASAA
jgi:hypothetical protein